MHQKPFADRQFTVRRNNLYTRKPVEPNTTNVRQKSPYALSDRGDTRKLQRPEEQPQIHNATILPDTEEALIKYLENLNRCKIAEKERQARKMRTASIDKRIIDRLSGKETPAPVIDHVRNNVKNARIPRSLIRARVDKVPAPQKTTAQWITKAVPQSSQGTQPAKVHLISRAVSTYPKAEKTVTFEKKKPFEIKLPTVRRTSDNSTSSKSKKTVQEKEKKPKKSQRIPKSKRSDSPVHQRKCKSPLTEVAKWTPQSVTGLTRPYYEAWVDTKLSAAVYQATDSSGETDETIDWNDKRMLGTIRVRR